ncbi:hypothetical protein TNCV_2268001 [Trichonephila clavipes]|nr:hypothetical protein TNCV_2268001 [Trichonephila clavipes]
MFTSEKLSILKCKRITLGAAVTRLLTKLNDSVTTLADIEFNTECLQIKINELTLIDDEIHSFLSEQEYSDDIIECEKYPENIHLLLFNSKKKVNTSAAICLVAKLADR